MNIIHGDSLDKLKELEDNSVDSIVTDPPYGLSFMGKRWDYDVPSQEIWEECLRVLKPGGYLLAFAGTRTQHRMAVRIEDAGFEIRDMIMYVYGSGFPKSLNVWKQLKKNCKCGIMEEYEESRNERGVSLQQEAEHDLRFMWERNLSQTINPEQEQGKVLQSSLSEQSISISRDTTCNGGRGKSSLERWDNNEKTKGELQGSKVCKVSKRISSNGKEGRIHNGTQISDGSTHRKIIGEDGSSTSRRPQSEQQQNRKPCTFCKQHFAQAIRAYGFGSAIKPSVEPITLARKPISEKNIAQNVLKYGTGGINIDGCRVGLDGTENLDAKQKNFNAMGYHGAEETDGISTYNKQGRFPANLIHDGSDEVVGLFPNTKSGNITKQYKQEARFNVAENGNGGNLDESNCYGDNGSASRFFQKCEFDNENKDYEPTLKPSLEPITVARKPLSEKTVAENVLKYGTGGINIDGCRVEHSEELKVGFMKTNREKGLNSTSYGGKTDKRTEDWSSNQGRFPANLIHDGSDEVVGLFPESNGQGKHKKAHYEANQAINLGGGQVNTSYTDKGSASRFFYCAKASKSERNKGLEGFEERKVNDGRNTPIDNAFQRGETPRANGHPTVKPISLMRYLCKLVTPKGGTVLDPFMGSGTTGIGAKLEGFDFIGIEREEEYIKIAEARINAWEEEKQKKLV